MGNIEQSLREGRILSDLLSPEEKYKYLADNPLPSLKYKFGFELEFIHNSSKTELAALISNTAKVRCLDSHYCSGSANNYWTVKRDGSLSLTSAERAWLEAQGWIKNNYLGLELVSPVMRENNIEEIYRVMKVLKKKGNTSKQNIPLAYLNETCSTHVHISVEDLNEQQRRSVYYTACCVEPQLDEMIKDKRIVTDHAARYVRSMQGVPYEAAISTDKYTSLRINGSNRDEKGRPRTFEYRKMNGTRSPYHVEMWIRVLQSIHSYGVANKVTHKTSLNLYDVLKSPILWDFYNYSISYLDSSGYKGNKKKVVETKSSGSRPRSIRIGSNL